jgi:hypothetical protein
MQQDKLNPEAKFSAALTRRGEIDESLDIKGVFHVECIGADGRVKWQDDAHNLVTTQGKNAILDKYLGLGAAYTSQGLGLHTTVGSATSTYATPAPQVEPGTGVYAARLSPAFAAASAGSKATSSAVSFAIVGAASISGCFVAEGNASVLTNGDVAASGGVLLSTGAFSGGTRAVVSGDTLNVTYSLAL